jgi:hypothetical protein
MKRALTLHDSKAPAKPRLLVDHASPDLTVAALRNILSTAPNLYDRGAPVRLAIDRTGKCGAFAQVLAPDDLVLLTHQVSRPYLVDANAGSREAVDVRLPSSMARMYLGWRGEWRLPPLNGIASAPLLRDDGEIASGSGYDPATGMWQENIPDLTGRIPTQPTVDEARAAMELIRQTFRTFFALRTPRLSSTRPKVFRLLISALRLAAMNQASSPHS